MTNTTTNISDKIFMEGEPDTTGKSLAKFQDKYNTSNLNLLIGNPGAPNTLLIEWESFNQHFLGLPVSQILYKIDKKEELYVTAVKNLRKKINFTSLNNDFQNGDISAEDFEKEIELNPQKYVVNVSTVSTQNQLEILQEVIDKIQEDFTIDEISEVFSLDISNCTQIKKVS